MKIPFIRVKGSGVLGLEFELSLCFVRCGCASNSELVSKEALTLPQCPHTSETCPLNKEQAIEVSESM